MSNLVIPLIGPPVVFAEGHAPQGASVEVRLREDETEYRVGFDIDNKNENVRGRRAVVLLTGLHIVLTGTVVIYDLDDDTIREVIEDLEGLT